MILISAHSLCEELYIETHQDGTYHIEKEGGFTVIRTMQDPCVQLRINGYYFVPEKGVSIPLDAENANRLKEHFVEGSGI